MCDRELETEQNYNILTPILMAITVSFPFSWAAQSEGWGPSFSGTCSSIQYLLSNSSDPQLIWSPTATAQSRAWGPSLSGCWFPLPHLISNSSDPQLPDIELVWSPSLNREPEGSLCWVLAFSTALVSNWLNFLCTELYNCSTSTFFLLASQFRTHSTCPRSRL